MQKESELIMSQELNITKNSSDLLLNDLRHNLWDVPETPNQYAYKLGVITSLFEELDLRMSTGKDIPTDWLHNYF